MKTVISARDIEELLSNGGDVNSLPADAIMTPSARDLLRDLENKFITKPAEQSLPARNPSKPAEPPSKTLNSKSPKTELEALFNSAYCHELKLQLCDIGRRLWQREYVDGNGGNIAIRVGEDIALCTPTLVSKGFMK